MTQSFRPIVGHLCWTIFMFDTQMRVRGGRIVIFKFFPFFLFFFFTIPLTIYGKLWYDKLWRHSASKLELSVMYGSKVKCSSGYLSFCFLKKSIYFHNTHTWWVYHLVEWGIACKRTRILIHTNPSNAKAMLGKTLSANPTRHKRLSCKTREVRRSRAFSVLDEPRSRAISVMGLCHGVPSCERA